MGSYSDDCDWIQNYAFYDKACGKERSTAPNLFEKELQVCQLAL